MGAALGHDWGVREFLGAVFGLAGPRSVRPEAAALVHAARAVGIPVGALTNDLSAFGGPQARDRIPAIAWLDVLVDGSETGVLKPDPPAYADAAAQLGHRTEDVVFLDDLPWNIEGALAAGMTAMLVDITAPSVAFRAAAEALGLPDPCGADAAGTAG